MSILFGHPTGNPNSHQAALAYFEAGWLAAFCLPWMPTPEQLRWLRRIPGMCVWAQRLERRCFPALLAAPRIEDHLGEWGRMAQRLFTPKLADDRLSYQANDWLMQTMKQHCQSPSVKAVHAYEDCALWQFEEAKRLGKPCIYDMPIGYYPAWEERQQMLAREYAAWLPPEGLPASHYVRPAQKRREMELADVVLAPSSFVRKTIEQFTNKKVALAPYGVDLQFWQPPVTKPQNGPLRFLYAGQISIRKGAPVLIEAWRKAGLKDAQLDFVGMWRLALRRRFELPVGVNVIGPCARKELRGHYQAADIYVLPSFFEGFALAGLEAMACGLPIITSEVMTGMDLASESNSRSVTAGDVESLIAALRWFSENRDRLPAMRHAARTAVEAFTWERYRHCVRAAVAPFVERN